MRAEVFAITVFGRMSSNRWKIGPRTNDRGRSNAFFVGGPETIRKLIHAPMTEGIQLPRHRLPYHGANVKFNMRGEVLAKTIFGKMS